MCPFFGFLLAASYRFLQSFLQCVANSSQMVLNELALRDKTCAGCVDYRSLAGHFPTGLGKKI